MLAYPIRLRSIDDATSVVNQIGVEPSAVQILSPKTQHLNIVLKSVKTPWANIIKQEMLSCGGDAAISKSSYACTTKETDVLLIGSKSVLKKFISKMKMQPECFQPLTGKIECIVDQQNFAIKIGEKTFNLKKDFLVLGILNITPDSFSDGGQFNNHDAAVKHVEQMLEGGADVIDVGGESTRPGSKGISVQEEIDRVVPIIESINKEFKVFVSIDSFKPAVIRAALQSGAKVVNDISGGSALLETAADIKKYGATALAMMNLTKGGCYGSTPEENLSNPIETFLDFCETKKNELLERGIPEDRLIFDPGIGFGLSARDTNVLLKNMYSFTSLGLSVCVGMSRKSYIGRVTGLEVDERDSATNAISLFLMQQGVKIFRTHDPKGLRNIIKLYSSIEEI